MAKIDDQVSSSNLLLQQLSLLFTRETVFFAILQSNLLKQ